MKHGPNCFSTDPAGTHCVHYTVSQRLYLKFKRILDILFSLLGLVGLSPVFVVIAAAIKLEDREGPVFYIQERIGRKGICFPLIKFRSMRVGCPELSTHEFLNAQNYITKVGSFLRRTSLDELPQLLNVLAGHMSLIGPRPLMPRERRVHLMRFERGIYQLRPGITGMAQTHGRDIMDDREKVRWDQEYMEQISLLCDIKLLIRTFFKVILREGILEQEETKTEPCRYAGCAKADAACYSMEQQQTKNNFRSVQ